MTSSPATGPAHGPQTAAVTVVVVTWRAAPLLPSCLDSISAQTLACRLLVIDNDSRDGTRELLAARYPSVRVVRLARNLGFAGGIAAAQPLVATPYLALLNDDAVADPQWLARAVECLESDSTIAAVTSRMLLASDDAQGRAIVNNAGVDLVRGAYGADRGFGQVDGAPFDAQVDVFGFSGGAAVLRRDAVESTGGMAARFFLYYEDTDLSWRLRLGGWRIRYEPLAVVRHRHAASSDPASERFAFYTERNRLVMLLRCAPLGFALGQLVRFGLTTASLVLSRARGRNVPDAAVFRLGLRLRVLRSLVPLAAWIVRERRSIQRRATVPTQRIVADWVGRSLR